MKVPAKLLGEMTEEELLDYRAEMDDAAAPYLARILAIDIALKKLSQKKTLENKAKP